MRIKRNQLLTNGLPICENCKWHTHKQDREFITCLLSGEEKGLVQSCNRFKNKTGEHITV